jgi:hypothetical protein
MVQTDHPGYELDYEKCREISNAKPRWPSKKQEKRFYRDEEGGGEEGAV